MNVGIRDHTGYPSATKNVISCLVPADSGGAHQPQSVSVQMFPGVLQDIFVWHPRAYDAKRRDYLGNSQEGEHVLMRNIPPSYYVLVEHL